MAKLNDILFNAAYIGFIVGAQSGRNPTSQVAADYSDLCDAAEAFATRVDTKIANDATISDGAGVALPPTTAAIQTAQLAKTKLMQSVCEALIDDRYYQSTTAADYDDLADVVAAEYTQAITNLV